MLHIEKIRTSNRESDSAWRGHLFVTLGPRSERTCPGQPRVWHPPTDVYETDSHVIVKIEVAGVDEDGITVRLDSRELVVSGCRDDPAAKLAYQQMEISYGEFQSSVLLPCDVDDIQARATYDRGFLQIILPKAQKHRVPVAITVDQQ
jgi:HSP20 family protein